MADTKQTFTITGNLDISQMIASTERLKKTLQSTLQDVDFNKIQKEFDKLAQAETEYQRALKQNFSSTDDIKNASKAIEQYEKTFQKITSMAETAARTNGLKLSSGVVDALKKEKEAIIKEQASLATNIQKWENNLKNAISSSGLSRSDKTALVKSFVDEADFKRELNRIKQDFYQTAKSLNTPLAKQYATNRGEIRTLQSYINDSNIDRGNENKRKLLSPFEQTTYLNNQASERTATAEIAKRTQAVQQYNNEINKLAKSLSRLQQEDQQKYKKYVDALTDARLRRTTYKTDHPSATIKNDAVFQRLNQNVNEAQLKVNERKNRHESRTQEMARITAQIQDYKKNISATEKEIKGFDAILQKAISHMESLQKKANGLTQDRIDKLNNDNTAIKNTINSNLNTERVGKADVQKISNADSRNAIEQQKIKIGNMQDAYDKNVEKANQNIAAQQALARQISNTTTAVDTQTAANRQGIDTVNQQITSVSNLGNTFDSLARTLKSYVSIYAFINAIRTTVRQTFNDVKELDKSFAEIAMVTKYSVADMWGMYDQYAEMGNKLGQTTQSVVQASGLFYQQGLDTVEALTLTEDTMKLATLAGLDFKEATSQMTAALRGFHLEMDEGSRVTDVYSELAAKAAADVNGIAVAMGKTASIAASAGMKLETTAALLTQMIETTQEAPENLGTAMKTVIARFTELKENVAGTAESEFDDLDYNKVDKALKTVGINIKDTTGQFRDLDDVFLELSKKWNTLDRNSQRYIATIAAGSRQQSRFIAMMENYDRTMELVDTAYNSAGKSSEQFAKYQDTIEYKITQLKNTWEQLRTSFLNSDGYKNVISFFNDLLGKVSKFNGIDVAKLSAIWFIFGKTAISNFFAGVKESITGLHTLISKAFATTTTYLANKFKGGFIGKIFKLKITPSTEQVDIALAQVQEKLLQLKMTAENLGLNFNNVAEAKMQLIALKNQLLDITAEAERLAALDRAQNRPTQSRDYYDNEAQKNLKLNRTDIKAQIDATRNYIKESENNDKLVAQRIVSAKAERNAALRGQALGQAFSMGITSAVTAVMTRDNPGEVAGQVMATGLMSTIPMIISVGMEAGAAMAAATGGLSLLVTGLVAGAGALTKYLQNQKQLRIEQAVNNSELLKTKKNIEDLTEAQEDLVQAQTESSQKLTQQKEKYDKIASAKDRLSELGNKLAMTNEEQEEFNTLSNEMAEQFPQLINYYDEQGNAILSMGAAWDSALDSQRKYYAEAQQEAAKTQAAVDLNKLNVLQQQQEDIKNSRDNITKYANALNIAGNAKKIDKVGWDRPYFYSFYADTYLSSWNMIKMLQAIDGEDVDNNPSFNNIIKGLKEYMGDPESAQTSRELTLAIQDSLVAAGRTDFKSLSATDVVDKILDAIDSDQALAREYQQDILKGMENIQRQGDVGVSALDKDIQDATNTLDKSLLGLVEGSLLETDKYTGASKNVQELMKSYASGALDFNYNDLISKFAQTDKGSLYYDNEGNLLKNADINKAAEAFFDWVGTTQEYADNITKITNVFNATTQASIDKFYKAIEKDNLNLTQQLDYLDKHSFSIDVKKAFVERNKELIKAYNAQMKALASAFNEKARVINENGTITKGGTYSEKIAKLPDTAQNQLYALSTSNATRQQIKDYFELITSSKFKNHNDIFGQIDLSQSYSELLSDKDKYIDLLVKHGKSLTEATSLMNDYLEQVAELLQKGFDSEGAILGIKDNIEEKIKNYQDGYKELLTAQKEYMEDGKLSTETYYKLLDAHFDDYVKKTINGYELIQDKVSEVFVQSAMQPYTDLKAMEKQQDSLLSWANTVGNTKFASLLGYKKSEETDANGVTKTVPTPLFGFKNDSIDDAIKRYKEMSALDSTLTREDFTQSFTEEQKKLFNLIIDKGYDTFEEYTRVIRENRLEMQKLDDDTYLQGLINLAETTEEAQEKAKELRESLKDLNKQLKDNMDTYNKAEKALKEAKEGTDNYQSGLDALINYNRELEKIEKNLDKTKEALEDVSSVDEAKELLGSLNNNYNAKEVGLRAENMALDKSLQNLRDNLTNKYSQYIKFGPDGSAQIDFTYQDTLKQNDEIKKNLEKEFELYNEYYDKRKDNDDAIKKLDKEREAQRKEALDNYIKIQNDVISILKEQAKKEIDTQKDKYKALEDADNDYLKALEDAINKQRNLREQEQRYEDLATKEKKLSLMRRDTSGANQKDIQSLEKEVKEDRTDILDKEVDNVIDSLKELYETQKEARDAEIEYMEAATENAQYFAEWAENIMSTWTSVEDMQSWFLENNPDAKDMTVEQTEQYLNQIKESYTDYVTWVAVNATDFTKNQEEMNTAINEMYENTSTNVENIGTKLQEITETAVEKAIEDATKARDDAKDKLDETQKKIDETQEKLANAELVSANLHSQTMEAMVTASQQAMEKTSGYATQTLANMLGVDLKDETQALKFAETYGFKTNNGKFTENFRQAVKEAGGDASKYESTAKYKVMAHDGGNGSSYMRSSSYFDTESEANQWIKNNPNAAKALWVEKVFNSETYGAASSYQQTKANMPTKEKGKGFSVNTSDGRTITFECGILFDDGNDMPFLTKTERNNFITSVKNDTYGGKISEDLKNKIKNNKYKLYKQGGLVNYTGPAWVDGTPQNPESFLNAEDTKRIGEAARLLSKLPIFNSTGEASNATSTNIGDTSIEIHINVEKIDSDYDVDQMVERVKQAIVDVAKPTGTSVILK